jgi:hypothetical protein
VAGEIAEQDDVDIMDNKPHYEEGSKLLTAGAFEFVFEGALKRAVRSQNHLTLVTMAASRESDGDAPDEGMLKEVAQVIGSQVRDTDVMGYADRGTIAIALIDTDFDLSARVIDRLVSCMEAHEFPPALRVAVGAACYPTHAVDADSLKREALSHPMVKWRARSHSSADHN